MGEPRIDPEFGPSKGTAAGGYGWLALASLFLIFPEVWFGFGLGFAPGWANGWPGGLTMSQVWSAGMTLVLFVILATLSVALGASLAFVAGRWGKTRRYAGFVFAACIAPGVALAIPTCYAFRESTREEIRAHFRP